MIKVGITGNTGSELDRICSMVENYYEIPVFDADLSIKFKLLFDPKTIKLVSDKYGKDIYKNGYLNLDYFETESSFRDLISLLDWDIQKKFITWRYEKHYDKKLVFFKSMILNEFGFSDDMDYNISVYKPKSMRVSETRVEKFLPSMLVNKIFNSEMSDDLKNGKANYVIHNYEPYMTSIKTVTEQLSTIIGHLNKKTEVLDEIEF
jgi:dephospho-CoA kinase